MEPGMRIGDHFMRPPTHQQPPPPPGRRPENQSAAHNQNQNHHQPPPPQKCPRCDSSNTKFCYYNNYSLSQPRYFCKACRRYWTHGGTLRNVPVGGGCRKSKRPKTSAPSSSPAGEAARNQSFSGTPQNLTGTNPGQPVIRAPIMPSMGNNTSFYTGTGAFLSSLAAMQALPGGAATANFVGNGQYDANVALFQNLQSLRPQNDHQIFASQQSLSINPVRPLGSWTQSFIRASSSASAGPSSEFWSRAAADGENQAGSSSFDPNDWPDNSNTPAGFDPSR